MAFLLRYDQHMDGTTVAEYDDGPTRRVQVLTLSENAQAMLAVHPNDLLATTLRTTPTPEVGTVLSDTQPRGGNT